MVKRIQTAVDVRHLLCECGCNHVYVYLIDNKGEAFARFSLNTEDWIPFGAEAVRIAYGLGAGRQG